VRFGGVELAALTGVTAVGAGDYHFQNVKFVPATAGGLLEFVATAAGDATLLLDAINIVERDPTDIVVQNPSFEGTGLPSGVGYIQPNRFAGWTPSGGAYGVNLDGVGPFTDNGDAPSQDIVGFLQGAVSIAQTISGLTPGQNYTLAFSVNARSCCSPPPTHYNVSLAGAVLLDEDVAPVGGPNPYVSRAILFTAASSDGELRFSHVPPGGDYTLLLDEIRICAGDCRPKPRLRISFSTVPVASVRISWPSTQTGYVLQFSNNPLGTDWLETGLPVQIEGDEFVVFDDASTARSFYRLIASP